MRHFNKIVIGILSLSLTVFMLAGCTAEEEEEPSPPDDVTQEQEESQAQAELAEIQDRYDELSVKYDNLESELAAAEAEYSDLSAEYDELSSDYDSLNAQYSQLSTNYSDLSAKYDALTQEPEPIDMKVLEQVIFDTINQNRVENRLPEIVWSDGLYWWSLEHSNKMALSRQLEYASVSYYQAIFRAAGYHTAEDIANAAMIVWKNSLQYETNFLQNNAKYGAVAVAKSGEVFFITFFAHYL